MFKLLVIARSAAGSINGGCAMTSKVIEFSNPGDADFAAEQIEIANKGTGSMDVRVIKLYQPARRY